MKPGTIPFATRSLARPVGWDEASLGVCDALEIRDRDGVMESAWYPSEAEKAAIAAGNPIVLAVWGGRHPPVSINVGDFKPCECGHRT
jgi:hypothetical protein